MYRRGSEVNRHSAMSDLKFQLRLTLSEEAALVARNNLDDASISSLMNILNKHDAVLKCQFDAFRDYVSEAVAKRAGRPADDLAVRTVAGAVIGVIMSITMPWEGWSTDRQGIVDMFEHLT